MLEALRGHICELTVIHEVNETWWPVPHADLLRQRLSVPMSVAVTEDLMQQPVASAVHPASLKRAIASKTIDTLRDDFFRVERGAASADIVDLVVEAVPGADPSVAARQEHRRQKQQLIREAREASNA